MKKPQPKHEHPFQQEWDQIREQSGSELRDPLPLSPHTGEPYDPELLYQFPIGRSGYVYPPIGGDATIPVPRVDRRLISTEYR